MQLLLAGLGPTCAQPSFRAACGCAHHIRAQAAGHPPAGEPALRRCAVLGCAHALRAARSTAMRSFAPTNASRPAPALPGCFRCRQRGRAERAAQRPPSTAAVPSNPDSRLLGPAAGGTLRGTHSAGALHWQGDESGCECTQDALEDEVGAGPVHSCERMPFSLTAHAAALCLRRWTRLGKSFGPAARRPTTMLGWYGSRR